MALQDYYNTGDVGLSSSIYGDRWRGQTFTTSVDYSFESVKLKLERVGSPGTITVVIKATSGGKPTGADLASGTTDGDTITEDNNGEWREVTFSSPVEISASTQYAIIVKALSGNSSNYIRAREDDDVPEYTGGAVVWSTDAGSSWNIDTNRDILFECYGATGEEYDEGTKVISSTGSIILFSEDFGYYEGLKSISCTGSVLLASILLSSLRWPLNRSDGYAQDYVWDEETESWVDNDNRAGGRYKANVVAINDQGDIYYREI